MHYSVLLDESVTALDIKPNGLYIDGTFGRGGHTSKILEKLTDQGQLIVFDKDPQAINYAKEKFGNDSRVRIVHKPFSNMYQFCLANGLLGNVDGILLDLGVSSPQLDQAERGFSFMQDGPLDMRMDTTSGIPASEALKLLSESELANIFKVYGEERFSKKIAAYIKADIAKGIEFNTTLELANLIKRVIHTKEKKHPATRCFQALRIYVNDELGEVEKTIADAENILKASGKLVVISFHSLEDRIVKKYMTKMVNGKTDSDLQVPRGLPILEDVPKKMKWVVKMLKADGSELSENVRSRSAILRAVEKL